MVKLIKRLGITLVTMITLGTTFAGGVYASESYHKWAGSDNYTEVIGNLDKALVKWGALKEKKDALVVDKRNLTEQNSKLLGSTSALESELANKQTELANKQTEINNKQAELNNKQAEVDQKQKAFEEKQKEYEKQVQLVQEQKQELDTLKNDKTASDDSLKQAEKDMQSAKGKSEALLNKMQE